MSHQDHDAPPPAGADEHLDDLTPEVAPQDDASVTGGATLGIQSTTVQAPTGRVAMEQPRFIIPCVEV